MTLFVMLKGVPVIQTVLLSTVGRAIYSELERMCKDTDQPSHNLTSSIEQRKIQAKFFKLIYTWDILTTLIQFPHGFPQSIQGNHMTVPHISPQ